MKQSLVGTVALDTATSIIYATSFLQPYDVIAIDPGRRKIVARARLGSDQLVVKGPAVIGPMSGIIYVAVGNVFSVGGSCEIYALMPNSLQVSWRAEVVNHDCYNGLSAYYTNEELVLVSGFGVNLQAGFTALRAKDGSVKWETPLMPSTDTDEFPPIINSAGWIFAYVPSFTIGTILALNGATGSVMASYLVPTPLAALALGPSRQLGYVDRCSGLSILQF